MRMLLVESGGGGGISLRDKITNKCGGMGGGSLVVTDIKDKKQESRLCM